MRSLLTHEAQLDSKLPGRPSARAEALQILARGPDLS